MTEELKPGPELDAAVAEEAMEWKWNIRNGHCYAEHNCFNSADLWPRWEPSIDIAAAWEVVEKLGGWIDITKRDAGWWVRFEKGQAIADTAPLAICLAALKANGK